jgi:hypothetical protein
MHQQGVPCEPALPLRWQEVMMTQAWFSLTGPDGREHSAPTEQLMTSVLAEVFERPGPSGELRSAALRFGYDDGLMYVAEVRGDGLLSFEEWSDRDCEIALAGPRRMAASAKDALQLWSMLARRQVSKIRELAWAQD